MVLEANIKQSNAEKKFQETHSKVLNRITLMLIVTLLH